MTIQQWYDGYQRAYELAQKQGIRGGVVIGHGFRIEDKTKERYRREGPDMGAWEWIQTELSGSWRDYVYWSPHWHIIGLCRDLDENKPAQQGGWNITRIRSLDGMYGATDENAIEDMARAVGYILDHATYESGTSKDCVRWFGELSTSKFSASEEMSDGVIDAIDRIVEEVVGSGVGGDRGDARGDGEQDRECDDCGGSSFSSIFDAGLALQDPEWCEQIGREKQRRLTAAFEWRIGERLPPPGARRPTTTAESEESIDLLLS
jgi:hypothetical protein